MIERRATKSMRHAVILAVLLSLASMFLAWSILRVGSVTLHNCQQVELLKSAIRSTITQSIAQLDKPGTAGYEYYKAHPAEKAAALRRQMQELVTFGAHRC